MMEEETAVPEITYPCKGKTKGKCAPGEMVEVELFSDDWQKPLGQTLKVQSLLYCGAGMWCQLNLFQFSGENVQRPALCSCE